MAVAQCKLLQRVADMELHRVDTHTEAAGDGWIAETMAHAVDHAPFGRSEQVWMEGTSTPSHNFRVSRSALSIPGHAPVSDRRAIAVVFRKIARSTREFPYPAPSGRSMRLSPAAPSHYTPAPP